MRERRRRDGADGAPSAEPTDPPHATRIPLDLPLYVERLGHGDPLILLHGFGASRVTWRHWVPDLARSFTAYLVDMRGFGSALRPVSARYAPDDMADDVRRMILELDLRRVTLVGHSIGGGVALLTTLRLHDQGEAGRVARLISVAGTAYDQKIPYYVEMLRHRHTQLLLQLVPTRWLIRKIIRSIVYDVEGVSDELVEHYANPLRPLAAKRAVVAAALQIVPEDLDELIRRYPELDVPTLLLWGRHDPVVPLSVGERLARDLPDARLVVLERCGHMPQEELPEESLAVVRSFLTESALPADGARRSQRG
jgi:pimeloyl-ACP methyl ester carboxylesterase